MISRGEERVSKMSEYEWKIQVLVIEKISHGTKRHNTSDILSSIVITLNVCMYHFPKEQRQLVF